uniref:Uncharacterized protein n=1 Tax=Brassica oleracea TaxID=3712 RepID=A0A3P6FUX3_BRAOL|nr:unnamed protein product [Brassica oleracea]
MYGWSCGAKGNLENGWNPRLAPRPPRDHIFEGVPTPATALVDKPSFFTPKYQTKGKGVVDEEGEDEAAQAIPDDSQPHQLLPSDSSQYKLQELPPSAAGASNNIGEIRA